MQVEALEARSRCREALIRSLSEENERLRSSGEIRNTLYDVLKESSSEKVTVHFLVDGKRLLNQLFG